MHTTVWQYHVAPGREAEFEDYYGSSGPWVALFRRAPGYLETVLLRDVAHPEEYVSFDRWRSTEDYARFRATCADDYARLDATAESLTTAERHLGTFES
jgi:heme-degrading monooxygenase HmoA